MKVHHLNCGTFEVPLGPSWVTHVLLIETDNGLVMVDSGFGLHDVATPQRIGLMRYLERPVLRMEGTAAHQVERLGFRREEVRHIILTHGDVDHTGGLADFPQATVHLTSAEAHAVSRTPTVKERFRYHGTQLAHRPELVEHEPTGEKWRGFAAAKELVEIAPGIVLLSVPGHTRGHAAIAVDAGHRWILHVGDLIYHPATIDKAQPEPRWLPPLYAVNAHSWKQVRDNQARLTELFERRDPNLLIVSGHSRDQFDQACATQPV